MDRYYIGLDCGGSKTRGVLADKDFRIIARAGGGPGNPLSAGSVEAFRTYRSVIRLLLAKGRLEAGAITAVGLGAAGAGRMAEQEKIERILRKLLPRATITVSSDGVIALLGATRGEPGIIVIAGTGSLVLGVNRQRTIARAGGWGYLFGDEGSGATLGREAVQAVFRAEDGRVPATSLRSLILGHYNVRTIDELITHLYRKPPSAREYARLWPALWMAARQKDAAAQSILRRGAEELGKAVEVVARKLNLKGPIPLILACGVLSQDSLLRRSLVSQLKRRMPKLRVTEAISPPEIGALHLATNSTKLVSIERIRRLREIRGIRGQAFGAFQAND